MFADLDDSIRELLIRQVPLDPSEVEISFDTPDREWSGRLTRPTVNCFLYDVRENVKLRQPGWQPQRGANNHLTSTRAPLRFDATYQVTVWARAREDEHRLLGRVLATLARHSPLPNDVLQGELKAPGTPIPTSIADPEHIPTNFAELWQGLDNRVRPVLTYVVTLALDLGVTTTAPLVLQQPTIRVFNVDRTDLESSLRIRGSVRDQQNPTQSVADALVLLRETGDRTITDEDGRFTFGGAPRGPVTLVVRKAGRDETVWQKEVPGSSYDLQV